MRIVQVMGSGEVAGGLEKHFYDLCNALSDTDEVVAVAHPFHRPRLSNAVQFEEFDFTASRRSPLANLLFTKRLRALSADIVHAHASKATAMLGLARPFIGPAMTVATLHGVKSQTRQFRNFDRTLAVSRAGASQINSDNVRVIYNGTNLSLTDNISNPFTTWDPAGKKKNFLAVGRFAAVKGFNILLDAWNLARPENSNLVLVGDGPLRPQLEEQARRLNLLSSVYFAGYRLDIPAFLAHADAMIMSSHREGFSYAMVEALQARLPIISTRVSGTSEVLPRELLVETGSAQALSDGIQSFLGNEQTYRDLYAPVWKRAATEFTLENMVRCIRSEYQSLLQRAA